MIFNLDIFDFDNDLTIFFNFDVWKRNWLSKIKDYYIL